MKSKYLKKIENNKHILVKFENGKYGLKDKYNYNYLDFKNKYQIYHWSDKKLVLKQMKKEGNLNKSIEEMSNDWYEQNQCDLFNINEVPIIKLNFFNKLVRYYNRCILMLRTDNSIRYENELLKDKLNIANEKLKLL